MTGNRPLRRRSVVEALDIAEPVNRLDAADPDRRIFVLEITAP